jgi:hypothetical protein
MKDWERIRYEREDLTDYVIHFTRNYFRSGLNQLARQGLANILKSGHIGPTFAPKRTRYSSTLSPTIKGPSPAVCLTEQPISAILKNPVHRYSGYGIAYHKVLLYQAGGRPVLYGSERELGRLLRPDEPGWQDDKEIFTGGLPQDLQYLWVRYKPLLPGCGDYPVDFTWEREWRIKPQAPGLPVLLTNDWSNPPKGMIIVEKDEDVPCFREGLTQLASTGQEWARHLTRIVSLETAKQRLQEGDVRFAKLDTWPTEG